MSGVGYKAYYKNIAILPSPAEALLATLLCHIQGTGTKGVIAPIRTKDLLSLNLLQHKRKWLQSLIFTFPMDIQLQQAISKERLTQDSQIFIGKIFIDLSIKLIDLNIPFLIWGISKLQEENLQTRLSLLLSQKWKAVCLHTHTEDTHSPEELKTFVQKFNPRAVYITKKSLAKFPKAPEWLPQSIILVFDEPLTIYTQTTQQNHVLQRIAHFFHSVNPWTWITSLRIHFILHHLREQRSSPQNNPKL